MFGANPSGLAHLLHAATGMVFYVLDYFVVARPLQWTVLPALPWLVPAITYGVALWIFAFYVMAHLEAGMPVSLGFTGMTWIALWGHIL